MKKYKKTNLNVISINTLTLILAILFLTIGFDIQKKSFFSGTIFNEIFIILLPALLMAQTGKVKEILKLNKISIKTTFLTMVLVILAYPLILLLNGIFLTFLSNIVEFKNYPQELFLQNIPLSTYLIFMCIIPAICEEVFFRGALMNSYSIYGNRFAIIMSSMVFALFHFDIQNFIAPLLLGILFANVIDMTGSIYAAMIAHLTNNVVAVISARYLNDTVFMYLRQTNLAKQIGSLQLSVIILLSFISILSVFLMNFIIKLIKKDRSKGKEAIRIRYRDIEAIDLFNFVPIIALVILYFIYYYIVF
ncbi:MAG: type II CAAX endopeptidase family protein [Tissierellia bacterium]|nr:type II CAAX endopeptidase family protein [Tissierellia bacterium]